ncbi:MAG: hypothetical protein ACJASQ_004263 [Crocinitomicaceae bacterium]|jgi:hypothetical protein
MKQLISFLLISILISSCGTSASFSKRKHLKGHFWKKSGMYGRAEKHNTSEAENSFSLNEGAQFESNQEQTLLVEKTEPTGPIESFKNEEESVEIQLKKRDLDIDTDELSTELAETETTIDQNSSFKNTSP